MTEEVSDDANWGKIPERMRGALARWIQHGIAPGDFLTAVLKNDLAEACLRADDENIHLLCDYIKFLQNYAPMGCWGSPKDFDNWQRRVRVGEKNRA